MSSDVSPFPGASGPVFPKRFYKEVGLAEAKDGFALLLDGRPARSPARSTVVLPTHRLAEAVAREWSAVETTVDPRTMPLTRLANAVIDGVSRTQDAVLEEILRYAGSDLLVYRASEPADLVARQRAAWDPILDWVRVDRGLDFLTGTGIVFVPQAPATLDRFRDVLHAAAGATSSRAFRLGALHVMTTSTGSALLALGVAEGQISAEAAWAAAHVDEDHQISHWGEDDEARDRRARRWTDMHAAAVMGTLSRKD